MPQGLVRGLHVACAGGMAPLNRPAQANGLLAAFGLEFRGFGLGCEAPVSLLASF